MFACRSFRNCQQKTINSVPHRYNQDCVHSRLKMDPGGDNTDVLLTGNSAAETQSTASGIISFFFGSHVSIGLFIISIVALLSSIIGIIQSKQGEDEADVVVRPASDEDEDDEQTYRQARLSGEDKERNRVYFYLHLALIIIAITTIVGVAGMGISDYIKQNRKQSSDQQYIPPEPKKKYF